MAGNRESRVCIDKPCIVIMPFIYNDPLRYHYYPLHICTGLTGCVVIIIVLLFSVVVDDNINTVIQVVEDLNQGKEVALLRRMESQNSVKTCGKRKNE